MSFVVLTNSTLTDPADKTEVEANFDDLKTVINGNLNTDNISELDVDKLTGQFYNMLLPFPSATLATATAATSGNTILIPHGTWTIVSAHWMATDIGAGAATVVVEEGAWNGAATPAFTVTKTTNAATISTATGTFVANTFTGSTTGAANTAYRLNVTGNDGAAQDIYVTVVLKRKIHT